MPSSYGLCLDSTCAQASSTVVESVHVEFCHLEHLESLRDGLWNRVQQCDDRSSTFSLFVLCICDFMYPVEHQHVAITLPATTYT